MAGGGGADEAGEVEVISDPAEVAAAREAWRRTRAERLAKLLPTPSFIGSTEGWDLVEADPALAFDSLVKVRDDAQHPPDALRAAAAEFGFEMQESED